MKIEELRVGQALRIIKTVWEAPSGESPGGVYGSIGDKVLIQRLSAESKYWPIYVHHEHITDGRSFGVELDEVQIWTESESTTNDCKN